VAAYLLAHPEVGLHPVGFCGDLRASNEPNPVPWLGSLEDAPRFAGKAEIAIVALSSGEGHAMPDRSRLPFRRIIIVPNLPGLPSLFLRTRDLGGLAALEFRNMRQNGWPGRVKRLIDLCLGLPLLALSAPLMALLGLTIKAISPGPALYMQRRVGWRGAPINILKLRSMHLDAERRLEELLARDPAARLEWKRHVKLKNDPRILPHIGPVVRRTSADELPQLWNVIRGEISLVGPRPFPAYHIERFDPAFQELRASVRPGLTGLWQVSERSNADLRQQESIDRFYILNWSLWLDFYIILSTLPAILNARGAR
jgi:lipopolysaccharide/colanic/teichoic acid biosynthesis glycosyltransferase